MTDKIDHLVKIWRSENFGNFDLLTPFMAIVLFPVSPPSSTVFIYHTQEGYRHVHVHPKPYRAYMIIRIEIRFISSR